MEYYNINNINSTDFPETPLFCHPSFEVLLSDLKAMGVPAVKCSKYRWIAKKWDLSPHETIWKKADVTTIVKNRGLDNTLC